MGRWKTYSSAAVLEKAVDAYFRSISYQRPVIVDMATGYVDEDGHAEVKRVMLREGEDGTGKPVTVTEWFDKPSLAALCLYIGISKETWRQYAKDETMAPVIERAKLRMESYWNGCLDGKGAHGAQFVLKNNFGEGGAWSDKVEHTGDTMLKITMDDGTKELAE